MLRPLFPLLLVLTTATANDVSWPVSPFAARLSRRTRCGLVRAVFSGDTFADLDRYLASACVQETRIAGRALVEPSFAIYGPDGNGRSEELFARRERCEGPGFVVLTPAAWATDPKPAPSHVLLTLLPGPSDGFDFGVTVATFPTEQHGPGSRGCGAVSGTLRRRGSTWRVTPRP